MRRWTVAVSVALTLGAQAISIAQAAPDFSGTWRLNQAKSSRAIVGNTPDIQFASQLEVKQSATDISIIGTSVRQQPVSAVYKLDGRVAGVVEALHKSGAAGSLLVLPEGLMLNYLLRMPSPLPRLMLYFSRIVARRPSALCPSGRRTAVKEDE